MLAYLQISIAFFIIMSIAILIVWYSNSKNEMIFEHKQIISELETAIYNNHKQVNYRSSNLNRYNFLKYNLNEALITQSNIQV